MANRDTNSHLHHALPARPPSTAFPAPPARPHKVAAPLPASSAYSGFVPRSVTTHAYPQPSVGPPDHSQAPGYVQASVSVPFTAAYATNDAYYNNAYPAYPAAAAQNYLSAMPMGRDMHGGMDPDEEAKMAEWNSAYNKDETKKSGIAASAVRADGATPPNAGDRVPEGKRKTVVREGGGKQWEDPSLLEWNPLHPRLFIGNLAGEVTDDSLLKAFSKYPSLVKARVVRDKKSTKSKSYGFVSFSDTDDFFRAAKEMNGKYIGSHPVLIKRANTEIKAITKKEEKPRDRFAKNKKKDEKSKTGPVAATPPMPNPVAFIPRGVQKKGKSNERRILG